MVTDDVEFGDGFLLAGCTFVSLLGQQLRSQALGLTTHVLRVYEREACLADAKADEEAVRQASLSMYQWMTGAGTNTTTAAAAAAANAASAR